MSDRALLLHGFGGAGSHWAPLLARLDLDADAPDFPGHGDHPDTLRSFEHLLDFADALFKGIKEPVLLFAHSMGGVIAQHMATRYPEKIKSLFLFSTASSLFLHPQMIDELKSGSLSYDFIADGFPADAACEVVDRVYSDLVKLRIANFSSFADEIKAPKFKPSFETILIGGSADSIVSPRRTRKLAKSLSAKLHVIEGVGHYPHLEQVEHCAEFVKQQCLAACSV